MTRTLLLASLLLAACGQGGGRPDIAVSDAWAREARAGSTAAYMRIANRGSAADRLVGIAAPAPMSASIHQTTRENGISRMRPLHQGLEIAAGDSAALEPGGAHVMLTGLDSPLAAGESVRLVLRFERSGERVVEVEVRPAAAPAGAGR